MKAHITNEPVHVRAPDDPARGAAHLRGISWAAGIVVCGVGCVVLTGWFLDIPVLKSIHPAWVSMKPNTALSFFLVGLALSLQSGRSLSAFRTRTGQLLALFVAVIGGLTVCEYVYGWNLGIDEILIKDNTAAVATSSPGRMALATAVCFILQGLSLWQIEWEPRRRFRLAEALSLVAALIGLSSIIEYVIGQPILCCFGFSTRMALHTSVIFLMVSIGVVFARPTQGMIGMLRSRRISPREWVIYAALSLLLVVILAGGGLIYQKQKKDMLHAAEAELKMVTRVKTGLISQWRAERLADASVIMESAFLNEGIAKWMEKPTPSDMEKILLRFRSTAKNYRYLDVLLMDTGGCVRLSITNHHDPMHIEMTPTLAAALRDHKVILSDQLHSHFGDLPPHMDLVVPLPAPASGAIVLLIDANTFFSPLIMDWPVPNASAETLLVGRNGDDVVFYSSMRYLKDTAFNLRIPLTHTEVPAVQAVLGKKGIVQGTDYRGVAVLSFLAAVPDSSWFIVAKMDMKDVFASLEKVTWILSIIIILLILIKILLFCFVWNQCAATEVLRVREEFLAVTLHSIGDGVLTTDTACRITRLNAVAERLTGWTEAEAQGRPVDEVFRIINEETRQPSVIPVDTVLKTGKLHGLANHTLLIARNGTEYPIADSAAPIRDLDGQIFGVVLVFRDVTVERQADQAIRRLNAGLEQRTRELANAKEKAEEATRAKSIFLANMSHEIRTPLNAIIGFGELLSGMKLDGKLRTYVESIWTASKSLLRLLNNLLDMSKIEAGRMELHTSSVDVRLLLEEVGIIFAPRILQKGISFATRIDPELPREMLLDEIRLRQILVNLVGNALNFTNQGTISVTVSQRVAAADPRLFDLEIAVEDTGIGIPETELGYVFGAFRQQSEQRTAQHSGTGLGLAISQRLAALMNGAITVKSKVGQGSTFSLHIPAVAVAPSHAATPDIMQEERAEASAISFCGQRVLIVDDVESNRVVLRALLEQARLTVIEAHDGPMSITLADEGHVDLIIMDIRMPGMSGFQATATIKNQPSTRSIPVIALTASMQALDPHAVAQAGFFCYLVKPVATAVLLREIDRALGGVARYAALTEPTADALPVDTAGLTDLPASVRDVLLKHIEGTLNGIVISRIHTLVEQLEAAGAEHHAPGLVSLAHQLAQGVNLFDILLIKQVLQQLDMLLSKKE